MQEILEKLGKQAAQQALIDLAGRSFGAVQSVNLLSVKLGVDEEQEYALVSWHVESLGAGQDVLMVILPEFLEGNPEVLASDEDMPAWLTAQMAGYIVDQVISTQQEPE